MCLSAPQDRGPFIIMHRYRTHTCGVLREADIGKEVRLSGWCHRIRDHGGLLFIDLRDHYGITQVVADPDSPSFKDAEKLRSEWVVRIDGKVRKRPAGTENPDLPTGAIEVYISEIEVLGAAAELPMPVFGDQEYPEDIRLKYRFLDLRRERLHRNIMIRGAVIDSIRRRMKEQGFFEFQTPILTASSPEGARDYLVPSRLHPGKFYALPQAPQQFKQLIMVSGFDRYFQIAPCFRDEDARADRSPGEFYQLDLEMSFVTQQDVFDAVEPVMRGVFEEFSGGKPVTPKFPLIPVQGCDGQVRQRQAGLAQPARHCRRDRRIQRCERHLQRFQECDQGRWRGPCHSRDLLRPRSRVRSSTSSTTGRGRIWVPLASAISCSMRTGARDPLPNSSRRTCRRRSWPKPASAPATWCSLRPTSRPVAARLAGAARTRIGEELGLVAKDRFEFCWIVDFPMYEWNEEEKKIDFSHNPFSMPNMGMDEFLALDPSDRETILAIKAIQYDIVCNGIELSSGAIRNHRPEVMRKAFAIAGYGEDTLEQKFGGMLHALSLGAPPHGGIAPGIDRIVMLLCGEENLREVVLFPMNQRAEDLMMGAPSEVTPKQLRELHIRLNLPEKG